MGTPMAPNYSNLFMDYLENRIIEDFFKKKLEKDPCSGLDSLMTYFLYGFMT